MFILNKKGDVNWFVVSIILAVITLAVLIMIFFVFPWNQTIDRAACKQSILVKALLPGDNVAIKDTISLRCKSRSICITAKSSGKGNCTNLGKTYDTQRLSATTVEGKKDQIKMFLSREMADCWNMFGEGKLQIFSRSWTSASNAIAKGIICDKIEFDSSVLFGPDGKDSTEDDVKNVTGFIYYMSTHKVPTQNYSYMDYLRNSPEGDSAAQLYGNMVNTKQEYSGDEMKSGDIVGLSGVKSIVYIETTRTNLGKVVVGTAGAVAVTAVCIFVPPVGSFVGRGLMMMIKPGLGGTGARLMGIGVAGTAMYGIDTLGDKVQSFWSSGSLKDSISVGGLIFTDYSLEGFAQYGITEFQNL